MVGSGSPGLTSLGDAGEQRQGPWGLSPAAQLGPGGLVLPLFQPEGLGSGRAWKTLPAAWLKPCLEAQLGSEVGTGGHLHAQGLHRGCTIGGQRRGSPGGPRASRSVLSTVLTFSFPDPSPGPAQAHRPPLLWGARRRPPALPATCRDPLHTLAGSARKPRPSPCSPEPSLEAQAGLWLTGDSPGAPKEKTIRPSSSRGIQAQWGGVTMLGSRTLPSGLLGGACLGQDLRWGQD